MRPHFLARSYGWPTVRKFPRSMAEAFPAEHADPIEHCPSPRSWLLSDLAVGITLVGVLAAVLFGAL